MATYSVLMIETPTFLHFVKRASLHIKYGVDIVGVVDNSKDALELIRSKQPEVLLVDIREASLNGLKILADIRSDYPQILAIGRVRNPDYKFILGAIAAGVIGFINDRAVYPELVRAIQAVRQGYPFLPQNIEYSFVLGLQQDCAGTD
jgi:DNA-binding NarL/FixJ family response regulator